MHNIWFEILCAKSPGELSTDDWKTLRKTASAIYNFDHERKDNRLKRLCNVLGYTSISDIGKKREKSSLAADFLIKFEMERWPTGLDVEPFCDEIGFMYRGTFSMGQPLRNKYYSYIKMFHMTIEELFEFEYGKTYQEYLLGEEAKRKIKITKPRPKNDVLP